MSAVQNIILAGIGFEVTTVFDQTHFFGDFLTGTGEADVKIAVTKDEIREECRQSRITDLIGAERMIMHRKVADILPSYDAFVCHGAALSYGGKGFLFCGRSGAGKTTHSMLWEKYLGDKVKVINGDKPIIRIENGTPVVYSSPWAGKEDRKTTAFAPLCGICFIKQGKANTMTGITGNCAGNMLGQIYLPQSKALMDRTLMLADRLLCNVPVYELDCDISEEAFRASFAVLTGENK